MGGRHVALGNYVNFFMGRPAEPVMIEPITYQLQTDRRTNTTTKVLVITMSKIYI